MPEDKAINAKNGRGKTVALAVVAVLLLLSLATNGYLWWNEQNKNSDTTIINQVGTKYILSDEQKQKIDDYLKNNNLNEYGDPKDTVYSGGSPLFNEQTGETLNRYDYIIDNNTDVQKLITLTVTQPCTQSDEPSTTTKTTDNKESFKNSLYDYRLTYDKKFSSVVGDFGLSDSDPIPNSDGVGKTFVINSELYDGTLTNAMKESINPSATGLTTVKDTKLDGVAALTREYDQEGLGGTGHYHILVALKAVHGNQRKFVITSDLSKSDFEELLSGFNFEE